MTIERYRQFQRALRVAPLKGRYLEYEWGDLPGQLYVTWMPYGHMFEEFARELANAVNALTGYTHRLTAWRDVVAPLNVQQQMDVAVDFVDSLATVALNLPYVIRSRFIFAAAHLCHQAHRGRLGVAWKDDFPLDGEIWFETADKHGKGWTKYNSLKTRLEKIAAKDYQRVTNDFRNAYNHRFSPRVVVGMTQVVTRGVDKATGHVSYSFGGTPALTLPKVVDALELQCSNCYRAFEAFQGLIREHEVVIKTHNAQALAAIEERSTLKVSRPR